MSFDAKKDYIEDVSVKLEDELTVSKMRTVQKAMIETFEGYTIEHDRSENNVEQSKELMDIFAKAKLTEGKSRSTISLYRRRVDSLLRFCGVPLKQVTVENIRDWFEHELSRGINANTVKSCRHNLTSVFGWLYKEELIPRNPCNNLSPIKVKKVIRKPFSDAELELIREACTTKLEKALTSFLLATGARVSEVCALNISDVDFKQMEAKVLGKGNKERTVYLDEVATMNLEKYLASRNDDNPCLFFSYKRVRITVDGVRKLLKRIERRTGVPNIHPHRFRRTLATILYHHGMAIQEIAQILGHEKIDTTMGYIFVSQSNVKTSYRRYF